MDVSGIFEGAYEILGLLGQGGFGVVYKAKKMTTGQLVAIKTVLPRGNAAGSEKLLARFLRETQVCAQLFHPNIVQLIDAGKTANGELYSVFAYVPGTSLSQLLRTEGALDPEEARHLMLEVLDALACAHERGIIHRDLKPANIMVAPTGARRNALVLDFGISMVISSMASADMAPITATNDVIGTPGYAAPEQFKGLVSTRATDLFSWGLMFIECLTGQPVYSGDTFYEVLRRQLGPEPVQIPSALRIHPLGKLLEEVTRKDPATRPESAVALLKRLQACDLRGLTRAALAAQSAGAGSLPLTIREGDKSLIDPADTSQLPGGAVGRRSRFYASRPEIEDACLREVVRPGALIRIKGPKQVGKTSLLFRILEHAAEKGASTVNIDLQMADAAILTDLNRFLRWLCAVVSRRLKIPPRKIDEAWDDLFGAKDNCTAYFEEHILPGQETLVLALDNVDRLLESPETAEEVLALLRAWHEMSKCQDPWLSLRLLLVYSTEIYLPMNINRSPFNVGLPVTLSEWDPELVKSLAEKHGLSLSPADIGTLMGLLGGHPHLIRTALYHLAAGASLSDVLSTAATDQGLFADHLKDLLWQVQSQPDLCEAALRLMTSKEPVRVRSQLSFKLVSLGLAHLSGNEVRPARELYRRYFTERLCAQT